MTSTKRMEWPLGLFSMLALPVILNVAVAAETAPKPGANVPAASGMRVHVDPDTGAIVREPTTSRPTVPMSTLTSTSTIGLVETPSPVPGGGVMVRLRGRFLNPLLAAPDGKGGVRAWHAHENTEE